MRIPAALTATALLLVTASVTGAHDDIERTPCGRPDLAGEYHTAAAICGVRVAVCS